MIEGRAAASRSRKVAIGIFVHQEADRAAVHAVDRLRRVHDPVQRLQHQAVAAERDDDVGVLGRAVAVARDELLARLLRLRARSRPERRSSGLRVRQRERVIERFIVQSASDLEAAHPRRDSGCAGARKPRLLDADRRPRSARGGSRPPSATEAAGQDDAGAGERARARQIAEEQPAPEDRIGEQRIFQRREQRGLRAAHALEPEILARARRRTPSAAISASLRGRRPDAIATAGRRRRRRRSRSRRRASSPAC